MIKKIFFILIIFLGFQIQVLAGENGAVLNLKTGNSYIIPLDARPMHIKTSNPDVVKVDAVTNIDESDSSLMITTKREGISYVTYKIKEQEVTMKLLVDNMADEDKDVLKLDILEDLITK